MALPARTTQKWLLLAIATLLPATIVGTSLREEVAQAHQRSSMEGSTTLTNGIYLYGNSPQANELAGHYVVFERYSDEVVGAFYSPRSEFTCFAGKLQDTELDVEAVVPNSPTTQAVSAQLENLHSIKQVTPNDQQMLATCKQEMIVLAG